MCVLTLLIKGSSKTISNFPFMVYDFNALSVKWQFVLVQTDQGDSSFNDSLLLSYRSEKAEMLSLVGYRVN